MRQVLLLVLAMLLIGTDFCHRDTESTEIEIVIVKAPSKEPRNPYQEEYERMLYPTVRIIAGYSTGSGVIFSTTDELSRDRDSEHRLTQIYILTASHVVEDEITVNIELYNLEVITGTVVITDTVKDLALIRTQINADFRIYEANLAPQDYTYYLFTPVYAVGCSLGLSPRPSSGILSALSDSVVEISAPVLPGNSGGPVYSAIGGSASGGDAYYQVIGIAVWVKVCQGQLVTTMAGVVPINEIYEFLDSHRDTEPTEKNK